MDLSTLKKELQKIKINKLYNCFRNKVRLI